MTELFSGLFFWLVSCIFLLIFTNNSDDKSNQVSALDSSSIVPSLSPDDLDTLNNQLADSLAKIAELEQKLQLTQDELNLAQEKIMALEEELELTSNQLESTQDQSDKLRIKLEQDQQNLQQKLNNWQKKYETLNQELTILPQQLSIDWQQGTFEQLQSLFANYPTAKMMVKLKPELPAKNLVALLKPLEDLWQNWGIEQIGKPWQKVPFNPQYHQPDTFDIVENELVYIRFVGYRQGDRILLPAKVSRNLPR